MAVVMGGLNTPLVAETAPTLEEIVVTAEKRDASLQGISQAVTVMSGDDLERFSVSSFVDLNGLVPGMNVVKNEGTRFVISMRGIGNEANQNAIASPAVSYHIDGVYMASPHVMQTELVDIARLEVLRGPQGTVFGQNSTGGAINVVTTSPSFERRTGSLSIELGSYENVKTNATTNLALSDKAALRLSFASNHHAGYAHNIALGQALDDARSLTARSRLYLKPHPDLEIDFVTQIATNHRNGPAQKGIFDPTADPRELVQDSLQMWDLNAAFMSASIAHEWEQVTLKSVSSVQHDALDIVRDNDRHHLDSLPRFTVLPAKYDPWFNEQQTLTQEIQLISNEPWLGHVDWIAGYFYFQTDVYLDIYELIDFGADGTFDPVSVADVRAFALGDYGFINESDRQRRAHSLFTEGNINLSADTRLISGLRLSKDGVESEIVNFFGRSGVDTQSTASTTLTGRVSLERDLSELSMLYLSLVRGYKPAGSNLTFGRESQIAPIVVLPTYKKETVNTVELGLKTDTLNRRVRFNGAIFQYNYKNLQYQATDPEVFEGGVNNIPTSRITGAEVEVLALLTPSMSADLRLSLLDTEITSHHFSLDNVKADATTNALLAQGLPLFGPDIQRARASNIEDVFGNELAKSPRSTLSFAVNFTQPWPKFGLFDSSIQVNRRGAYHYRVFNHPETDRVSAYTTFSANLRYEPNDAKWYMNLRLLNISDVDGVNARFTDVFGVGASSEELIPPRRIMLGFGTTF